MDVLARRNDQADMPVDADEASDSVTTTAASPTSTASPTASSTTLPVLRIIADDALTAFHEHAPDVHDRTALPLTEEVHYRRLHDHHAMPDHFAHEMRRAQLQVDQRFKSAAARQ